MNTDEKEIFEGQRDRAAAQARIDAATERQRQQRIDAAIETERRAAEAKKKLERVFDAAQIVRDELANDLTNRNHAIPTNEPLPEKFRSAEALTKWRTERDRQVAERDALVQKARDADARLGRARMAFLEASGALDYARQAVQNLRNSGIQAERSSINYV